MLASFVPVHWGAFRDENKERNQGFSSPVARYSVAAIVFSLEQGPRMEALEFSLSRTAGVAMIAALSGCFMEFPFLSLVFSS